MKAISVRQPWASYICPPRGFYGTSYTYHSRRMTLPKDIENRGPTWQFDYTGPLLIHASKTYDVNAPKLLPLKVDEYALGCIIGVVHLDGTVMDSDSGWYQDGSTGLVLSQNYTFDKPIPWRGQLGLFDVPEDVVAKEVDTWTKKTRKVA